MHTECSAATNEVNKGSGLNMTLVTKLMSGQRITHKGFIFVIFVLEDK